MDPEAFADLLILRPVHTVLIPTVAQTRDATRRKQKDTDIPMFGLLSSLTSPHTRTDLPEGLERKRDFPSSSI